MSLNKAMNAVIAMLDGRLRVAKEMLRAPDSDVKNIPEVQMRLQLALDKQVAKRLRGVLNCALAIEPTQDTIDRQAFYEGVVAVEGLLEGEAERLEGDNEVNDQH
jgi:hypothetical protein